MTTPDFYTTRIIHWIHHHEYSRQHWQTVAAECVAQENGDRDRALLRLAQGIAAFHEKYRDAVVKPGNVLYEFIDLAFDQVDWLAVAQACIDVDRHP